MRQATRPDLICIALCVASCAGFFAFKRPWTKVLIFDDAYMFSRYAHNFANGLGISWNLDGVHTYGLTSLPWLFVVLPAVLLLPSQTALQLCSSSAAAFALSAMTVCVRKNACTSWLSNPFVACFAVALPLMANPKFHYHMLTGMDTLLAVSVNAVLVGFVLSWQSTPSTRTATYVGLAGFCAALVRLDSGLCALFVPFLAWSMSSKPRSRNELFAMCGIPALLLIAFLVACQIYFGTALPLSFYAKSAHGYESYLNRANPLRYFETFLTFAGPAIVLILSLARTDDFRRYGPFFIPSLITIGYLFTVRQIMGGVGRFYLPQLPFFEIPALLILDRFIGNKRHENFGQPYLRALMPKVVVVTVAIFALRAFSLTLRTRHQTPFVYNLPEPREPLPKLEWFDAIRAVAALVSDSIPNRGIIAASEVGYLGDRLPRLDVIDLVGLNDTRIGLKGLSMDYLLNAKPDLIWFPHTDYIGLRFKILDDPRLYEQYTVVQDAFNYGIAIRKSSPFRVALEKNIEAIWPKFYGGTSMQDYIVKPSPALKANGVVAQSRIAG